MPAAIRRRRTSIHQEALMGALSPTHILVLLVFGASRVPKLGRSMGEGIRGFKDGLEGSDHAPQHVAAPVVAQVAVSEPESPIVAPAVGEDGEPSASSR